MVDDLHLAAVRTLLSGDVEGHMRLIGEIDHAGSVDAYGLFYKVAFAEAVRRRFGRETTRGDIIRFVAETRSKGAEDIDILAAERLLLAMLGDEVALRRLSEDDSALIGPLLLELATTVPHEELLTEAVEISERLEAVLASNGREDDE